MYYFTITLDSTSPNSLVIEDQKLSYPLTSQFLEQIQRTISCLEIVLLDLCRFQHITISTVFSSTYPKATKILDVVSCVVSSLLILPALTSQQRETLIPLGNLISTFCQSSDTLPSFTPTTSSVTLPLATLSILPSSSAEKLPSSIISLSHLIAPFPENRSTEPEKNFLTASSQLSSLQTELFPLQRSPLSPVINHTTATETTSNLDFPSPKDYSDSDIVDQNLLKEILKDLKEQSDLITSPKALPSSPPKHSLILPVPLVSSPFPEDNPLSDAENSSDETSEEVGFSTIQSLYEEENVPTAISPIHTPLQSPSTNQIKEKTPSTESSPLLTISPSFISNPRPFYSDFDLPIRNGCTMTYRELIHSTPEEIKNLSKTLTDWPVLSLCQSESADKYKKLLFINLKKDLSTLLVSKAYLSIKANSLKNTLCRTKKAFFDTSQNPNITITIPQLLPQCKGYQCKNFCNEDLLLNPIPSLTKKNNQLLQLLYLLKLYAMLSEDLPSITLPRQLNNLLETLEKNAAALESHSSILPDIAKASPSNIISGSTKDILKRIGKRTHLSEDDSDELALTSSTTKKKSTIAVQPSYKELFQIIKKTFPSLIEESLKELSKEDIQYFRRSIRDPSAKQQTSLTFKDLITSSGIDLRNTLSEWPQEFLKYPSSLALIAINRYRTSNNLIITKKHRSFQTKTGKAYLKTIYTNTFQALLDLQLLITPPQKISSQQLCAIDICNKDLILVQDPSIKKIHYQLLQFLYIYKILKSLLITPLHTKSTTTTTIAADIIQLLDTYIDFFQQQANKLLEHALYLDPSLSESIIQPSTVLLPQTSVSSLISSSKKRPSSSIEQAPIAKKRKPFTSRQISPNIELDIASASPVALQTLQPLLLDENKFTELLPKNWLPENQTITSISTLKFFKNKTGSLQKIWGANTSSHSPTEKGWRGYLDTLLPNLNSFIKEPFPLSPPSINNLLLPGHDHTQQLHRLLQAFYFVKLIETQLSLFPTDDPRIPYFFREKITNYKNNLLLILQKNSFYIDNLFYEKHTILPSSSTPTLNYDFVFNLPRDYTQTLHWPAINTESRLVIIDIQLSTSMVTPVYLIHKTSMALVNFQSYLLKIKQSLNVLTECTTPLPCQIKDPEIYVEKDPLVSDRTHCKIQALLIWKIMYQNMKLKWKRIMNRQGDQILTTIASLEEECKNLIAQEKALPSSSDS